MCARFEFSFFPLRCVVSRTGGDEAPTGGAFQLDPMKRTVSRYAPGPIDDSVLTTQIDVGLVQIPAKALRCLVEVHLTPRSRPQAVEGSFDPVRIWTSVRY